MLILPAIDLYEGRAVRLYKGDYEQMTVYSGEPAAVARDFAAAGAVWVHVVDLEGARDGGTPNLGTVRGIARSGLKVELGGGLRSMAAIDAAFDAGAQRVVLGTAAVSDSALLRAAAAKYAGRIAAGCDLKNGEVAVRGWTEGSGVSARESYLCSRWASTRPSARTSTATAPCAGPTPRSTAAEGGLSGAAAHRLRRRVLDGGRAEAEGAGALRGHRGQGLLHRRDRPGGSVEAAR